MAGKPQTDSRITLLTGVHRKDVKRLRDEPHVALRAPRVASLSSQLIARWTTLPEYLDEQGAPRPLPRLPADAGGGTRSNRWCARSTPTSVRASCSTNGCDSASRTLDDADRVHLKVQAFVPSKARTK